MVTKAAMATTVAVVAITKQRTSGVGASQDRKCWALFPVGTTGCGECHCRYLTRGRRIARFGRRWIVWRGGLLQFSEETVGVEPTEPRLGSCQSIGLLGLPHAQRLRKKIGRQSQNQRPIGRVSEIGRDEGTRTPYLRVNSSVLYPVELHPRGSG